MAQGGPQRTVTLLVAQDRDDRIVYRVMGVLKGTEALNALIGILRLIVAARSEKHGGPGRLDHGRESGIGLIQQWTKLHGQAIAKREIEGLWPVPLKELVHLLDRAPDFAELFLAAQIGGADTPEFVQSLSRNIGINPAEITIQ
jgi:hypothetical protein